MDGISADAFTAMFGLLTPKEIKLFNKGLDLLEHRLGTTIAFSRVRQVIEADVRKAPKPYIDAVRNSSSPEQVAATTVANVAGDIVESGELCIYRGLLSPAGQEMLKVYSDCLGFLLSSGFIDVATRDKEMSAIRRNIESVG